MDGDSRREFPVSPLTVVRLGRLFFISIAVAACARRPAPSSDGTFESLQQRGGVAMGVDQYTSAHVFESLPTGGRIVLDRAVDDSAGVSAIRAHMREIATAFARGDFATPGFVHALDVPGTRVMTARRSVIGYAVHDRPRGAELRIVTEDAGALEAVHAFLAFQRQDHRAPGHEAAPSLPSQPPSQPQPAR